MSVDRPQSKVFTKREREALFLELVAKSGGISVAEVYREAASQGDQATEEAYYNLARRLLHRGMLVKEDETRPTRYKLGQEVDSSWLEEEDLAALVSEDYPLLALPIWKEAQRQVSTVPEDVWVELRTRLAGEGAQELFIGAISSYADDLDAAIKMLCEAIEIGVDAREMSRLREEARNSLQLLYSLARYGLGLSREAVPLPETIDQAIENARHAKPYESVIGVDHALLADEISRRVLDEAFVCAIPPVGPSRHLTAAVDGSTRGGLMSFLGDEGDFYVGYAPMISINTSVGQINRDVRIEGRNFPAFLRLPEKPEDMQQRDNRYTVMAKLFCPDLSDSQYMHSVWNAMDALEARVCLRMLRRWSTAKGNVEVPPADVVLRDGTVSPQDRDFSHYRDPSTYGRIVRDIIETNWEIATKCREDQQTLAGVVKSAELRVFGPVLGWYAAQLSAKEKRTLIGAWPMRTLNMMPDQVILTRLLTAGTSRRDSPFRTCLTLRPFHAPTNFGPTYSRDRTPAQRIFEMQKRFEDLPADTNMDDSSAVFWRDHFRGPSDSYVQMLQKVWYGGFFVGAVPRLDADRFLPRIEVLVPESTEEKGAETLRAAAGHLQRLLEALRQDGFEVSLAHSIFKNKSFVEVLPALLIRVHDTVKIWAEELMMRVQEYVGNVLSQYVRAKKVRGVKVRPFRREELKMLLDDLETNRKRSAGAEGEKRLKP
jgi:hypothetical protein